MAAFAAEREAFICQDLILDRPVIFFSYDAQHSTKALINLCTWMTVRQTLISFSGLTDQYLNIYSIFSS